MKRPSKGAIDLYEEAVYLLRRAPTSALAAYYAGSLPFILGFLFFWADMSHSAFAYDHCAPAALGLSLLLSWMMYWQALFVRRLHAELSGVSPPRAWSKESLRLGLLQIAMQPTKFLALPVALLTLLPFASTYAFYQNLMAVRDGKVSAARKQALVWQTQNWTLLAILAMLEVVVFINIGAAILIAPYLAKLLLGVENVFTHSGVATMNTTFFAVAASLTYLVTNPLAKAVYLLRYFYSESIKTGEDLRVAQAFLPAMLLMVLPILLAAQLAPALPTAVSVDQLNHAIDDVIHQPEFTWRLPRPLRPPENNPNWFIRATQSFLDATARGARQVGRWADQFINWLGEKLKSMLPGLGGNKPGPDTGKLRALLYTLLVAAAMLLGWLLWRTLRSRKQARGAAAIPVTAPAVELNDTDLQADQQPLDQWLQLARDLMARQDFRLALRAFYLASLAHLAERSLISIQRGKSNQDYARELRRKTRATPELMEVFAQNMGVFERTWYGQYQVDRSILEQFESNLAKMRTCALQ
ncbi:MAG: DUF4129 domain-containing protein [Bryobacteraceae bacterium]|jgi:hypothetical protein